MLTWPVGRDKFARTQKPPRCRPSRRRFFIAVLRLRLSGYAGDVSPRRRARRNASTCFTDALALDAFAYVSVTVMPSPGGCDAPRGIWRVDLQTGRVDQYFDGFVASLSLVAPCGSTLTLSADERWAVTTETTLPVPDPRGSGALWVFDTRRHTNAPVHVLLDGDPVAAAFVAAQ